MRKVKIEKHQRCESGSTGYSYPEPTEGIGGLPRALQRSEKRVETQNAEKPKKKVQFRNVATEPDLSELNETSMAEESHDISRQDTMVEHSVVVHEEVDEAADYLQALDCAKFEQQPLSSDTNQKSGECEIENPSNPMLGFTKDEDNIIEKTLLQIRDRIRSGLPLSHQINY